VFDAVADGWRHFVDISIALENGASIGERGAVRHGGSGADGGAERIAKSPRRGSDDLVILSDFEWRLRPCCRCRLRPFTLADKQETTRLLRGVRRRYHELNGPQAHLGVKGGKLARLACQLDADARNPSDVIAI